MTITGYIYDNAWQAGRQRLAGLEALWDPGTVRHLERLGVGTGWRCLELGAGAGSIATWLCERVGPLGTVLATDIDTRFLDALREPNLEVRRHDIGRDNLPADTFDLIHNRLVLSHVPNRDAALARLVVALRPGGWLLAEEVDTISVNVDPGVGLEAVALWRRDAARSGQYPRARRSTPAMAEDCMQPFLPGDLSRSEWKVARTSFVVGHHRRRSTV